MPSNHTDIDEFVETAQVVADNDPPQAGALNVGTETALNRTRWLKNRLGNAPEMNGTTLAAFNSESTVGVSWMDADADSAMLVDMANTVELDAVDAVFTATAILDLGGATTAAMEMRLVAVQDVGGLDSEISIANSNVLLTVDATTPVHVGPVALVGLLVISGVGLPATMTTRIKLQYRLAKTGGGAPSMGFLTAWNAVMRHTPWRG